MDRFVDWAFEGSFETGGPEVYADGNRDRYLAAYMSVYGRRGLCANLSGTAGCYFMDSSQMQGTVSGIFYFVGNCVRRKKAPYE